MTHAWLRDLAGADPYRLLGLAADATFDDVRRAYRRRIRDLHPDRVTGDTEQARLVNLARDVLLDPVRRAEYDRLANQPSEPEPSLPSWDAEDVVVDASAGTDPPQPSAWDSEDVVVGAEPPRPSTPPEATYWSYEPSYQETYHQRWHSQPTEATFYRPFPVYYPQPSRPLLGLPISALVCAFLCWPVGFVLGLVALWQHRRFPGAGRRLAIAAIAVSLTCVPVTSTWVAAI